MKRHQEVGLKNYFREEKMKIDSVGVSRKPSTYMGYESVLCKPLRRPKSMIHDAACIGQGRYISVFVGAGGHLVHN